MKIDRWNDDEVIGEERITPAKVISVSLFSSERNSAGQSRPMTICGCVNVEMVDEDKYKNSTTKEPSAAPSSEQEVQMEMPFDLVFANASLDADSNVTPLPLTLEPGQYEVFDTVQQDRKDANTDDTGGANAKRTIARIRRQRSSAMPTAHSVPTTVSSLAHP